ncbi:MAG: aminotransferase class III-fold pyridoxal phosphate-dependent enzyme, partial [Bacteroidia bacterium]|nr:aminotransferase class III-fold pyridoxal phosphate-dependent enzyme [Bacteroidia bacterium]
MNYSERLNKVIPGGAHTYSRGDDQYPENAPQILHRGRGSYVWDADGNKYLDYGMALRAVTVGYGYERIVKASIEQIYLGNNLTRASLIELLAAEKMVDLFDGMDMIKFAKNGSTVTSAAVKLARAYTGKKLVARCLQHPFFSYDDWFIGDTTMKRGIPEEISALTLNFNFNDIKSLEVLFEKYPNQIACVITEPATTIEPEGNFLHKIKDLCDKNKSVFILDEMITGFRWHLHGAQKHYNIIPDLCTFGKGMANGFSVAALMGK